MASAPCSFCGSTEGPDHLCPGENLQLVGQVLDGRYRIDDVLGQGGMGMVFRATQISVQREVALKTLHPALAAAPQFFERFRREAELASRLRHPNIITIFDFGRTADGTCYYVMEYLDGESLKQLVKRAGPLSLRRAAGLVEQAARALGHAHQGGVVHRDVKPHNIMVQQLDQRDFVKVLDFGLVKAMEQDEHQQLTSTGQVLGTPQYMPPEQAGGELVDHRSDLYSLAGVLYFCLTGGSPFGANTVRKALQASLTQQVPTVARRRNGAPVPTYVDEFLRKALAREKEDRYQSAEEFIEELRAALAGSSDAELDALPLPPDPSAPVEGSGSGSAAQQKGTVAGRRGSGTGRSARPSNVAVDSKLARPAPKAGSGSGRAQRTPAPHPRSGGGVRTAVLVAAPVLAALAVGGWLVLGGQEPRNTPSTQPRPIQPVPIAQPPEVSKEVTVQFESDPSGAGIYQGERQLGTTPAALRLDRATVHTFTFRRPGYEPVEQPVELQRLAEDQMVVRVSLKRAPDPKPAQPVSAKKKPVDDPIPVFE